MTKPSPTKHKHSRWSLARLPLASRGPSPFFSSSLSLPCRSMSSSSSSSSFAFARTPLETRCGARAPTTANGNRSPRLSFLRSMRHFSPTHPLSFGRVPFFFLFHAFYLHWRLCCRRSMIDLNNHVPSQNALAAIAFEWAFMAFRASKWVHHMSHAAR